MENPPPRLRFAWKPYLVQSQIVGTLVLAQFGLESWTTKLPLQRAPDQLILYFALFAGLNLAVMLAGDRLLRQRGWWRQWQYMALGALAASVSQHVALAPAAHLAAAHDGILLFLVATPLAIGATTAFLLHRSLGYAPEGDDPAALAEVVAPGTGAGALHATATAEYYDGPLQVRTSGMAAFVAALTGAAFYVVLILFGLSQAAFGAEAMPPLMRGNPILGALYGILGISALFYIAVHRTHGLLRRMQRSSLRAYVVAGLVVPLGFALILTAVLGPFGVIMALPWILPSAAAMATYHQFAGLEPLALPDDIEVSDRRTLLPADHVRRRTRRIVSTG